MNHGAASSAFEVLTQGLAFNHDKYGHEIEIFERCAKHARETAAGAAGTDDRGGATVAPVVSSGEQSMLAADDVQGNDPWEKANVIRKRNKIKVHGSAPPAPITSFEALTDGQSEEEQLACNTKRLVRNVISFYRSPTAVQKQVRLCLGLSTVVDGCRRLLTVVDGCILNGSHPSSYRW